VVRAVTTRGACTMIKPGAVTGADLGAPAAGCALGPCTMISSRRGMPVGPVALTPA
jgi:hypothetical protein